MALGGAGNVALRMLGVRSGRTILNNLVFSTLNLNPIAIQSCHTLEVAASLGYQKQFRPGLYTWRSGVSFEPARSRHKDLLVLGLGGSKVLKAEAFE